MLIVRISKIIRQDDWRFFDIHGEAFEVDKPDKFDCSVCALREGSSRGEIRLILPYSQFRKLGKC